MSQPEGHYIRDSVAWRECASPLIASSRDRPSTHAYRHHASVNMPNVYKEKPQFMLILPMRTVWKATRCKLCPMCKQDTYTIRVKPNPICSLRQSDRQKILLYFHRSRWGRLFSKRPLKGLGDESPKEAILDSSLKALVEKVRNRLNFLHRRTGECEHIW